LSITFYCRSEGKVFVANNGSFLEKKFLSKEVSERKVELDEVVEPSLESESSATPESVLVLLAPTRERINDNDYETPNDASTKTRRSTRTHTTLDRYGNLVLNIVLLDNDDPTNYEEAMMSPNFGKWLDAMKSEMRSMHENQVWTMVDLLGDYKAVKRK
jgi:hypothetical protein